MSLVRQAYRFGGKALYIPKATPPPVCRINVKICLLTLLHVRVMIRNLHPDTRSHIPTKQPLNLYIPTGEPRVQIDPVFTYFNQPLMKQIIFSFGALVMLASFNIQPLSNPILSKETIASFVKSGRGYTAQLTGTAETSGGDVNGTGRAYLEFNPGRGTLYYYLEVHNIDPATLAHIHIGATGVAGPAIVELEAPVDGVSYGTVSLDKETIKAIRRNPENYYVNVHNAFYPAGAVRGQIVN